MKLFKKHQPSEEALQAKKDVVRRKAESRKYKERVIELQTSDRIYAEELRSHNESNHYADFLADLLKGA